MDIRDGTCPKCGSDKIYASKAKIDKRLLYGNAILVKGTFIGKTAWLRHYVCAACSYIESYIADDESMNLILEEWQPLNKTKRKNEG